MPAIYKETIFADLCILQAKGQYRFFRRGYVPVEGLIHDKSGRNKLTCYKVHLHISIHIHAIVQCDDGFPIHNGLLFASFVNRKVDRRRGHLCFERPHLQRTRRNHIMKRTNNPIRIDQLLSGKRDGILLTTTERCARHETSPHKKFTKWTNRLKRRIICSYSACDTVQTDRGSRREFPLTSLKVVQHKVTHQLPLIHPAIVETQRSPQQTYGSTRNRTHRHLSSKRKLPRPRSCFIPIENGEGEAPNTKFFEDHTKQARVKLRKGMKVRSEEHTSELQSRGHLACRHQLPPPPPPHSLPTRRSSDLVPSRHMRVPGTGRTDPSPPNVSSHGPAPVSSQSKMGKVKPPIPNSSRITRNRPASNSGRG